MKIKVSAEASIDFEIKVNNEIVDEVIRNYNGDFNEWVKQNYMDYFDSDNMNIDLTRISFDKDASQKILSKSKELVGISNDSLSDDELNSIKLKESEIPNVKEDNLLRVCVDVETVKKASCYCDLKNPNVELKYIHIKDNIIEATDTIRLVRYKSKVLSKYEIFFPSYFIKPIEDGAELFISEDATLTLKYNGKFYEGLRNSDCEKEKPIYPNTDTIIPNRRNAIPFEEIYIDNVIVDSSDEAVKITKNMIVPKDEIIYINKKYWDIATKEEIKQIKIKNSASPVFLYGDCFQIALMPMYISSHTVVESTNT